jgi:hypothetical protein
MLNSDKINRNIPYQPGVYENESCTPMALIDQELKFYLNSPFYPDPGIYIFGFQRRFERYLLFFLEMPGMKNKVTNSPTIHLRDFIVTVFKILTHFKGNPLVRKTRRGRHSMSRQCERKEHPTLGKMEG